MMSPRLQRFGRSEDGAVALVTAILLTVLLALMAFVVDLGLVRADVRLSQSAADAASTAGIGAMSEGATYEEGCQSAVEYLESNLEIVLPAGFCSPFAILDAAPDSCETLLADGDPAVEASTTVDDYTVRIQMPVRDSDPEMAGQSIDADFDGDDPCRRMSVSVRRARDLIFGQFAGGSGPVSGFADAVSRYEIEEGSQIVSSLVVLDPTGCYPLHLQGNDTSLVVGEDSEGEPGMITVDSDGSECGGGSSRGDYTLRVGGSGGRICAGLTNFNAFLNEGEECDSAPETLFTPSESIDRAVRPADDGNIFPHVLPGDAVTRAPVDHRYNCRASYPTYPGAGSNVWHPHFGTIEGCEDRFGDTSRPIADRNHVDQLASHFAAGTGPTDWIGGPAKWDVRSGGDCNIGNDDETWDAQLTNQHLFIDCDVNINNNGSLTLDTDGYIVISGTLDVSGDLHVNTGDDEDVVMVSQGSGVALDGGSNSLFGFHRTFLFMHTGTLDVRSEDFTWTAPEDAAYGGDREPANCALTPVEKVPSPECFEDLALWSNHEGLHFMTGGGGFDVEGVFFAPNAGLSSDAWEMRGNSDQALTGAQFLSYRFNLAGNSKIGLVPDPERNVTIEEPFVSLIR